MLEAARRQALRWKHRDAADGTTRCIFGEGDRSMALRWKRRVTSPNGIVWVPSSVALGIIVESALECGVRYALKCMRWVS